jgi:D-threo-aldose 1-dehydrogenase
MSYKEKNIAYPVGRTSLRVSSMGFGCAPLGGTMGEPMNDEKAVAVVQAALQQGIHLFDTAPSYGNGLSEQRLGMALQNLPRDQFVLETKLGLVRGGKVIRFGHPLGSVRRSLEESLARLGLEYVDILLIHDADRNYRDAIDVVYPELASLRSEGLIKAIGAGMNQWQMLADFTRDGDFDVFMLAHRYTLLEQSSLDFLDLCVRKGISIHLAGVFHSGILATGAVQNAKFIYRDAPDEVCSRVSAIQIIAARYQVPLSAIALQFAWEHPAVTSLVVGMVTPEEVFDNLGAFHFPIPPELWSDLRSEGLIAAAAPLPIPSTELE